MSSIKNTSFQAGNSQGRKTKGAFAGRAKDRKSWEAARKKEAAAFQEAKDNKLKKPDFKLMLATVAAFLEKYPKGIPKGISTEDLSKMIHSLRPLDQFEDRGFARGGPVFFEAVLKQIGEEVEKSRRKAINQRNRDWRERVKNGTWCLVTGCQGFSYSKHRDAPNHVIIPKEAFDESMELVPTHPGQQRQWTIACTKTDEEELPGSARRLIDWLANLNGGKPKAQYNDAGRKRYWSVEMSAAADSVLSAIYSPTGGKIIKPSPKPRVSKEVSKHLTAIKATPNMFAGLFVDDEDSDNTAAAAPAASPAPTEDAVEESEHFPQLGEDVKVVQNPKWVIVKPASVIADEMERSTVVATGETPDSWDEENW